MRIKRGQSSLEYITLVIIVIGAFIATQDYIKRGIQGRWRQAADDLGDQYDPQDISSSINYKTTVDSITTITTTNANGGFWTSRVDQSNTIENKQGFIGVGAVP